MIRMIKHLLYMAAVILIIYSAASCGKKKTETDIEETSAGRRARETYAHTVEVSGVTETGSGYFGIMHALILDIHNDSGSTVYKLQDKADPENAWAVSAIEFADIEDEAEIGNEVSILFQGNIIEDPENVRFLVMLPDGDYSIKKITGSTTANMMSTFTVQTSSGEIVFNKDNCRIEDGAMQDDSGEKVAVYYADCGELGNYPFKVYKAN